MKVTRELWNRIQIFALIVSSLARYLDLAIIGQQTVGLEEAIPLAGQVRDRVVVNANR